MSGAFKTLKSSDIHVLPYTANKSWYVTTSSYSSLGIKMFVGQNITTNVFYPATSSYISNILLSPYTQSGTGNTWSFSPSIETVVNDFTSSILLGNFISEPNITYNFTLNVVETGFPEMFRSSSISFYLFDSSLYVLNSQSFEYPGSISSNISFSITPTSASYYYGLAITSSFVDHIFTYGYTDVNYTINTEPQTFDSASGDTHYRRLIYNTIKQLYYSNYLSSSFQLNSSSAENFEQTTINYQKTLYPLGIYQQSYNGTIKYFPTSSNSIIRVLSIPQNIFGSKIVPGTFNITSLDYNIFDDKEGNLFDMNDQTLVGNIIYPHGIIVITNPSYLTIFPTASEDSFLLSSPQKSGSFELYFKNEHIIYENEIRCTINEDEFNYSLNPSISTNGSGSLRGFATSSNFNPYTTTIGLYNEAGELLVVSKLAKPIQIPKNIDITFITKWDS